MSNIAAALHPIFTAQILDFMFYSSHVDLLKTCLRYSNRSSQTHVDSRHLSTSALNFSGL